MEDGGELIRGDESGVGVKGDGEGWLRKLEKLREDS